MGNSASKNIRICPLHSGDFEDNPILNPVLEPNEKAIDSNTTNNYNEERLGDIQRVESTSSVTRGEGSEREVDQEEEEGRVLEESFEIPISPGILARTASSLTPSNTTSGTISALSTLRVGIYAPHNIPFQTKSIRPSQPRTLCQKYPCIYAKSREKLLPLLSPQCRSERASGLISPRIPGSRCSARLSTEWRTNRFAGGTYIHYPSRTAASRSARESRTHRNAINNRLKPLDKSLVPSNSGVGDQLLISSGPRKPNTCILPPLSMSVFDKCRSTNGRKRNEDGGGLKIPQMTCFSSPRARNTDLKFAKVLHNDQMMSRRPNGDTKGCFDNFFGNKPDAAIQYVGTFRLAPHRQWNIT